MARPAQAQARPVVVLFGDSIAAGYGLPPEQGLAAALQAELETLGVSAQVRNAGVPGDTAAGGHGRMQSAVRRDTAVCVVEFGGNDRRAGYTPSMIRENLEAIITWLKSRNTSVVLAGLRVAETSDYPAKAEFNALYPAIAKKMDVLFYPELMAGVTPDLRQPDGAHPSAEGARVIAKGLAPLVAQALAARR